MGADTTHVFLNPTAGRGRAGRRQERILEIFANKNVPVELNASKDVGDLEERVLHAAVDGATRIVVAGGDGSVHEATNGILRSERDVAAGVIPSGTGNDFAKACSIPLNWEHATELLADRIAAEQAPRRVDVGRVNDRYFANGAGVGFDAKVTHVARSIRLPIGDIVYLLAIFKTMIGGIATPRLAIEADGFSWDGAVTLAAVSNGPWIGGMFHIAPAASNDDGQFDLLIAKPVSRRRILKLLPILMNGKHLDEPEIVHRRVTGLTIHSASPIPSHLDGEVQPPQSDFEIEILPGALAVL